MSSRFGRKLARLRMPGAMTVEAPESQAPSATEAPARSEDRERDAPDGRSDPFARATRSDALLRRGRGWDLDGADDSDGAEAEEAPGDVGAIGATDATEGADAPTPGEVARKARIARLQARIDAMVGRRQRALSRGEVTPGPDAGRVRAAPAGAWGRLARGSAPHAADGIEGEGAVTDGPPVEARDPDDFSGVPGALEETDFGPLHVVRATFDPDHCHGEAPVGRALAVAAREVARFALDPELAEVDIERALFLDTETTGLYGAGTVPFLIGLGWFEGGCLELRQLFLRRLGEERPMLEFLADRLTRASCIITYNGKSFDWPLIGQRFVMNRLPPPPDPLHLDLLHCARRAYKKRIGGARLVQIEERVLGMQRVDDTPGHEIPLIYLDFVRGGPADRVAGVIQHNAHDIVAMAALLGRLGERFAAAHRDDDPRDLLSYARIAERAGDPQRAADFARVAAERSTGSHAADAWLLHATLARRRGDVDEAQRGYEAALAEAVDREQSGAAHLALAKLFEHRRKDFDQALRHAYHTRWMEGAPAWQKRIDRIERKRARAAS